jgi:SAM-dependent methyltransferase
MGKAGFLMTMEAVSARNAQYDEYLQRYRAGEWRAPIIRDLIARDIRAKDAGCTILDIGCGRGFDDDLPLQQSLAALAGRYIGIEPDPEVPLGAHFTEIHRCLFEDAPLAAGSVDVAFAIMVLEHIPEPQRFWDRLRDVLKPGGVFWGLTVDGRSVFSIASYWLERLHAKEFYMRWLMGRRGEERYLNYPVFYLCNTPRQLEQCTRGFTSLEAINFARVGQHRPVVPRWLHAVSDGFDKFILSRNMPGTLLALRVVK